MFTQSYFWYLSQIISSFGGRWAILKIIYPRFREFLVMVHMDFLVVAYKNEPQDLWKLLCTCLKSKWKYSCKYFNNYYYYEKNYRKNILFPIYMNKIIKSFPYAVALAILMSPDLWKYETWHGNPIQVSVSRATPWKINWAATYGILLIILLIKTGNNFFGNFFHIIIVIQCEYFHSHFRPVSCHGKRKLMSHDVGTLKV